ncbi:uncharacterized protein PG986_011505 [Apiospora aurea]|uniref:Transposase n=1 Tax=Apiospora aurea TaxID=335848 RepID=A0ABR1PXB3_9PEZI
MKLPAYKCATCHSDRVRAKVHMAIVGRALLKLFTVLSTWEGSATTDRSLELELNAYSLDRHAGHRPVQDGCFELNR